MLCFDVSYNCRPEFIWKLCSEMYPPGKLGVKAAMQNTDKFSVAIKDAAEQTEINVGLPDLSETLSRKIREEAQRYYKTGNCRLQNVEGVVHMNPTLLNPKTLKWEVQHVLCPFDGYLPLTAEELDTSDEENILIKSCQKILRPLISSYRRRLQSVKIVVSLENALEFCYAESTEKFDVIDAANLSDPFGLANVLNAAYGKLSNNLEAVIFTKSTRWTHFAPSVIEYVEGALCCPLSMIPTIYGLRLTNHVELGAPTLCNFRRKTAHAVHFCWRPAPFFRNVTLSSSPTLTAILKQLSEVCYDIFFPRMMVGGSRPGDNCGMMAYTPFTFQYVTDSIIQRTGGDRWLTGARSSLDIECFFQLTKRTAEAWKKGKPIKKFSDQLRSQPFESAALNKLGKGTPIIRLVLMPTVVFRKAMRGRDFDLSGPNNYTFDNFHVGMKRAADGIETIDLSFLLPADHGLEKTHIAFIIESSRGIPLFVFKPLKEMRVENFTLPYPSLHEGIVPRSVPGGAMQMVVESCTESPDQYVLKIKVQSRGELSGECKCILTSYCCLANYCLFYILGLGISTNRQKPCESCLEVTVSLSNIEPFTMSFSHPILVDGIRATLNRRCRSIDLVLQKAVLEPWPSEFQNPKWNVDSLNPWIDVADGLNSQYVHLDNQFDPYPIDNPSLKQKKKILDTVRGFVEDLFEDSASFDYVCIMRKESSNEIPSWYLRIHRPVVTSPLGNPMLLISALDIQLADNTAAQNGGVTKEDFFRIFPDCTPESMKTYKEYNPPDLQLLRYVLRLNSTKMIPSTWQRDNLPLDAESPWLSTFLSPLYLDSPITPADEDEDDVMPGLGFPFPGGFGGDPSQCEIM